MIKSDVSSNTPTSPHLLILLSPTLALKANSKLVYYGNEIAFELEPHKYQHCSTISSHLQLLCELSYTNSELGHLQLMVTWGGEGEE